MSPPSSARVKSSDLLFNTPLHNLSLCKQSAEYAAAKARILLTAGFNPAIKNAAGFTVLHQLASPAVKTHEIFEIGAEILNHYLELHARYIAFLICLRKICPILYQTKGLHRQFFMEYAVHMKNLRALLSIQNKSGQTPYDIWKIDLLNPATCKYEKFCKLFKS